jgi:hypothetical protein
MEQKRYEAHLLRYGKGFKGVINFGDMTSTICWFPTTEDDARLRMEQIAFKDYKCLLRWLPTIDKRRRK